MVRQLLGAALLTLMVGTGACSSTPIDSTDQGSTEGQMGSVNLPLTTQVGTTKFRLNKATFTITGPELAKALVVVPPADEAVHNVVLPVGSYSILLAKGWVLEKEAAGESAFSAVPARLVTDNPLAFDVTGKVVADAFFGFVTTSGDVSLGNGSVNIRIGVQDCSAYDSITAALGELTADCLGTVDPRSYRISRDGFLTPAFASCPKDPSRMLPILQLLSLQKRTARLPFAHECLAGRFEAYQAKFAATGTDTCPAWSDKVITHAVDVESALKLGLPNLDPDGAPDTGQTPAGLRELKQTSRYSVKLGVTGQKCGTAGGCAAVCAGAYPGFVQDTTADAVFVDPVAWLLDTVYPTSTNDPYLRATYYHPMSYYGGVPGVSFGSFARFQPCGDVSANGVTCQPEVCSYYAGTHLKTLLQKDCLDDADITSCVSYCGPKLP